MNRTQTALLALLLGLMSTAPAGAQGPPVGATWWRFFLGGDPDSPSGYGIGDLVFMEAVRDSSVSATMRMVEVEFSISRI